MKYAPQRMDLCGRLADGGGDVTEGHLKCLSPGLMVTGLVALMAVVRSSIPDSSATAYILPLVCRQYSSPTRIDRAALPF